MCIDDESDEDEVKDDVGQIEADDIDDDDDDDDVVEVIDDDDDEEDDDDGGVDVDVDDDIDMKGKWAVFSFLSPQFLTVATKSDSIWNVEQTKNEWEAKELINLVLPSHVVVGKSNNAKAFILNCFKNMTV